LAEVVGCEGPQGEPLLFPDLLLNAHEYTLPPSSGVQSVTRRQVFKPGNEPSQMFRLPFRNPP